MISIVLPVHNQEDLICRVLKGICDNSSALVTELVLVFDGCTDSTVGNVLYVMDSYKLKSRFNYIELYAPNVWEVKACNVGYKAATQPYILNIQDDMIVTWQDFDVRLMKPMLAWPDVFAVTSLAAVNLAIDHYDNLSWYDTCNDHNTPRDVFAIRDTINRGPLLLRHEMLKELDYLDEIFAPQGMDDIDICLRAWAKGWVVGVYCMPAFFDVNDGTTRKNANSAAVTSHAWVKNMPILVNRHRAAITGPKHSENRELL